MPTCGTCGNAFDVAAEHQKKYPGWSPKECPACFRSAKRPSGGRGKAPRGGSSREENLTTAEVLEKYTSGPENGVFTDGSASPNPGPGGWGAVYVVAGSVVDQSHGRDPHTTNNRMELAALHAGVLLVPEGTPATIYSDSRLVVDTLNTWAKGWEKRGWKRKAGPIANLDLVQPLYELVGTRPELSVEWIAAHSGNRWNEYADSLSTAYSRDTV